MVCSSFETQFIYLPIYPPMDSSHLLWSARHQDETGACRHKGLSGREGLAGQPWLPLNVFKLLAVRGCHWMHMTRTAGSGLP